MQSPRQGVRLRTIIVLAAALVLAGCETDEDFWRPYHYVMNEVRPAPARAALAQRNANPIDAHCRAVARQRAADAGANGYSLEMENTIYAGTYKDCVSWDTAHRP